jgi:hypothetical protein
MSVEDTVDGVVPSSVFENIMGKNAQLVLSGETDRGVRYEITFEGSSIEAPMDFNMVITETTAYWEEISKLAEGPLVLHFDHEGSLPGPATVTVYANLDASLTYALFFFNPSEGAIYKLYTDSDKVEVGYYGGSFYVSETNTGEMDENGVMRITLLHTQVGNTLVIGLKSTSSSVTECTLTIEKESDIGISNEELPWEQYQLSKTPQKTAEPKGSLHYVQITADITNIFNPTGAVAEIQVYYNENDGFYHLSSVDGPILYVKINTKTVYHEALITIANVTNVGRYFYDENGNFLKKESYNDAIIAYGAVADTANGVVPLDNELIYILKNIGENGWYDMLSPNSIFADDEVFVYAHNAWLFAVCYFS